jgi:hypothetical protein
VASAAYIICLALALAVPALLFGQCFTALAQVPIVDWSPLAALLERVPAARVMVLNGFISLTRVDRLLPPFKKYDEVACDFAMLEGMAQLGAMVARLGVERVAFGSYSPMFRFESTAVKIREAALTAAQTGALLV